MAVRAYTTSKVAGGFSDSPNASAAYQPATVPAAEALTGAVTTQIAAAQAIGAGDASAEIDAADTAFQACVAALTIVALANAVTTDLAAAQAIGVGDASAEVDALDASFVAFEAGLAALAAGSANAGDLTILLNTANVTTRDEVRALFERFLSQLERTDQFT